jgi:hypothetical protein
MSIPYITTSDAIKGYKDSELAKSERGDCVVRSIASAYDIDYDKAHRFVATTFGRKPRSGTYGFIPGMNKIVDNKTRINRKLTRKVLDLTTNGGKSKMTVGTFSKWYDKGTYIINVQGHAFTIKDGQVIGNANDSTQLRKRIKAAWKVG